MTIPHNSNSDNPSVVISKEIVKDVDRLDALPKAFGNIAFIIEQSIYDFMEFLSAEYKGGYWDFFTLSNGGFFMAPKPIDTNKQIQISNPVNYSDETMTAEAAGICVCLMALSNLSFEIENEVLSERFYQLRNYAVEHPESVKILKVID